MKMTARAKFFLLCAFSLVVWWFPIKETVSLAFTDGQYTHILLIVPTSSALFYLGRKRLVLIAPDAKYVFWFLLALCLTVFLLLQYKLEFNADMRLTLLVAVLVIWWLTSFALCFGSRNFKVFAFPLCFLFWIVPWPSSFLDLVVQALQQYSATGVAWIFQVFGIPVLRDGVVLSIPGLTIEVAKECSSIRSSLILLVSSMVLAQLFLRSKWLKTVITLVAIPLSVAKNVIRIFTLSILGLRVNRGFLTGRLHHEGGVVFYAGALAVVFLLTYFFSRYEMNSAYRPISSTATR